MRRFVWSRNLKNEGAMARVGLQRRKKKVRLEPYDIYKVMWNSVRIFSLMNVTVLWPSLEGLATLFISFVRFQAYSLLLLTWSSVWHISLVDFALLNIYPNALLQKGIQSCT